MASEKFRHQLRKEVEQWRTEGLITSELYEQLTQRYQLNELDRIARNRFVIILLGLGAILIGLALITFVAANWQVWSRTVKVFLLLSLFVVVNTTGFYLWRTSSNSSSSRLGQGLLLLGGLILGANLALMSQMFHQSGSVYQLYLVWSLGVLAMAYSLRLTSLGILAFILTAVGYWLGALDLGEFNRQWQSGFGQILLHMPLLASLLFIPLAYYCRSSWLFGLSIVLAIASLEFSLLRLFGLLPFSSFGRGLILVSAIFIPPSLLWAYQDFWRFNSRSFTPISQKLAIFYLTVLFYSFSFHGWWNSRSTSLANRATWYDWSILVDLVVFSGVTLWFWWRLGYRQESNNRWRLDRNSTLILGAILITSFLFYWHVQVEIIGATGAIVFNLLLFFLAVELIRIALANGKRFGFWTGIILLSLQLFSRMFEYNTGLLLKAIVLFGCGIAVILAGLWFERYLRAFEVPQSNTPVE
jgi:uncharacterized membrane protein